MKRPNVILILNDDMGYSDLGAYGSEIETPNLDQLASNGLRFTQFYNTARCCPSRASLLTGLHPHQADVGNMVGNDGIDGYLGDLSRDSATIAEALKDDGYRCMMSGKWHVTGETSKPSDNWPCRRGFDEYYGTLCGAGSYYWPKTLTRDMTPIEVPDGDYFYTDAISDEAVAQLRRHQEEHSERPFFQYVAYTAPHWPLHALPEDIEKYKKTYDIGWDRLREQRLQKMLDLGLIDESTALSARDSRMPAWDDAENKDWEAKRMAVYAAQIDRMDQGIGRILDQLRASNQLENTMIIFLADNGGCAEVISESWGKRIANGNAGHAFTRTGQPVRYGNTPDIEPGPEEGYQSYGVAWANTSNTPFRKYKCWVHEGGISTPFIVHWPNGNLEPGGIRTQPAQLPDVMATVLDLTGSKYPEKIGDRSILPHEGFSLRSAFNNGPHGREVLTWEHQGNCGIRKGRWKLVREYINTWECEIYPGTDLKPGAQPWELYDIEQDRSELNDLADQFPDVVAELAADYQKWADRCDVQPWDTILKLREEQSKS